MSPGKKFREAVKLESPLQIIGVINAYTAIMAAKVGFHALYLSGAGVANASYGIPDTGETTMEDVIIDAIRIIGVTELPLLVDIDTGWEESFGIKETIMTMESVGVAAVQIEDQVSAKKCGHLEGKKLVSTDKMIQRLKKAIAAKEDPEFVIMARTDAYSVEGLASTIDRAKAYVDAGADMIFAEGFEKLEDYQQFCSNISVPVLANITEFGKTPLLTVEELKAVGVKMALYPLSAFRAMNQAALKVLQTIREQGTQQSVINMMQTRKELYEFLDYDDDRRSEK